MSIYSLLFIIRFDIQASMNALWTGLRQVLRAPCHCMELRRRPSHQPEEGVDSAIEEAALGRSARIAGTNPSRTGGFSLVELAISLALLLILTAIAIPTLIRSLRTYQLNDVAGRLSDLLKFTRFEAVRQNKPLNFQLKQNGSDWVVWADSNGNGIADPTEKQILITGFVTLMPPGGSPGPPTPAAITAALKVAALTPTPANPGPVQFDARGAVRVGGVLTSNVYVFYLGSAAAPDYGYRAVILVPSGSTQVWSAPAGGPWHRIS